MPKRGQIITAHYKPGQPDNRVAHLVAQAKRDGAQYADTLEAAMINQLQTKRAARAVSGANQRSRTEAKASAARDKRDNRHNPNIVSSRLVTQFLLPID